MWAEGIGRAEEGRGGVRPDEVAAWKPKLAPLRCGKRKRTRRTEVLLASWLWLCTDARRILHRLRQLHS